MNTIGGINDNVQTLLGLAADQLGINPGPTQACCEHNFWNGHCVIWSYGLYQR